MSQLSSKSPDLHLPRLLQVELSSRDGGCFVCTQFLRAAPSNVDVYPAAGAASVIPIKQSQPLHRHHQAIIIACAAPFKNNFVRERDLPRFASSFPIYPYILRQSGVGGGWLVGWSEPLVGFPPQTRCLRERRPRGSASISASSPTRTCYFHMHFDSMFL